MKLIALCMMLLVTSCSFEEELKEASDECETKVRKVFTEFEESFGYICLTEDEILEYIEQEKITEDHEIQTARNTLKIMPYSTPAKNTTYGVYDPLLKMCKAITDY